MVAVFVPSTAPPSEAVYVYVYVHVTSSAPPSAPSFGASWSAGQFTAASVVASTQSVTLKPTMNGVGFFTVIVPETPKAESVTVWSTLTSYACDVAGSPMNFQYSLSQSLVMSQVYVLV